jgi:hypothetical protein
MYRVRLEGMRSLAVLVPAILSLAGGATLPSAAWAGSGPLPAHVNAVYRISFTALGDIGHFRFDSNINGDTYTLSADAKIGTAIFDYTGVMSSKGALLSAVTKPAGYTFNYKQKTFLKKKKAKALSIVFKDSGAPTVTFIPPDKASPKAIPVTPEQLKNALDPLSGVMALSLTNTANPCAQKLPIYDGKQRFDLVFTPQGRSGGDYVCHVRLVPISGHKPNEGAASVIKGEIEVVLRPVPKANIVIPYRVTVPTIIGSAVLTSDKVEITMPDQQRIAFRK